MGRSQVWKLSAVGLLLVAMSGCSATAPAGEGGIEMAVSQTCDAGSAPECVSVNGEYVTLIESDFARAGVETAKAVEDGGTSAIEVRFDDDGAVVFQESTAEAAAAAGTARLVIRAGGEVLSAVTVVEPMQGDTAVIALPPGADAEELAAVIRGS
ncbi:SecDF P1 head subdomain-containing protein [Agromyces aureus]|uniref:SecDF P1 head subdomain domain-containing protein n=1 Tax=Agromyces aureus TaxID=453304 RepID=A0A191WCM6_9MICO|nr:hypothetical protein [Agromyces aureus]ANJ25987.1 hypothetical protein ATC03_03800 [Agromyces aureus]